MAPVLKNEKASFCKSHIASKTHIFSQLFKIHVSGSLPPNQAISELWGAIWGAKSDFSHFLF